VTAALIALAVAVLVWPAQRPVERRLLALARSDRLAGFASAGPAALRRQLVPSRLTVGLVAVGLGAAGTMWRGPVVGIAAAAAAAVSLGAVARSMRRATARAGDRDLSAALRLLRAELDVGSSAPAALTAAASVAGPHRGALAAAAGAVVDGGDIVSAVSAAGGERDLIVIARAGQLASTLGIPLAGVLARVDDDVQARRDQARVVASALAGPRSSSALLAGLPVLGIVLGIAMGARPLHVLLDTFGGQLLLGAGVLLDAAGVLWTARLITSAERS
jgi:tight adherence protein B